jgi:hypothetical protein
LPKTPIGCRADHSVPLFAPIHKMVRRPADGACPRFDVFLGRPTDPTDRRNGGQLFFIPIWLWGLLCLAIGASTLTQTLRERHENQLHRQHLLKQ